MTRRIACLVTIGLIFSCITALGADSKKELSALSAAEKWLSMVDSKKYVESWKETAEIFRNAVQPKQWVQSMQAADRHLVLAPWNSSSLKSKWKFGTKRKPRLSKN